MEFTEALRAEYEADGYYFEGARYLIAENERSWLRAGGDTMAMDAHPDMFAGFGYDAVSPPLASTASAGIPAFLTTFIDPRILEVRQAQNKAAEIYDEVRSGDWTSTDALFPVVENTGVTTAYGDYEQSGSTNVNMNWITRQPFQFQTMLTYGDFAVARAALGRIALAAQLREAAVKALAKEENRIYFKGVQGLANYGIQTDPNLLPAIAPAPKANGGFSWLVNGIQPNATPNEIFVDFQSAIFQLINQSDGNIDTDSEFTATMSPSRKGAITATNSFGVNTMKLLTDNFPKLKLVSAIQFGVNSAQNNQGVASEMMQVIAKNPGGQETGWVAFNDKLRAHRLIPATSSYTQKMSSACLGAVLRQTWAISTMIGL